MPVAAKKGLTRLVIYISIKSKTGKILEGDMFIRIQTITLPEIFCKTILNVKVIFKSITDPEEEIKMNGKMHGRLKTYFWNVLLMHSCLDHKV